MDANCNKINGIVGDPLHQHLRILVDCSNELINKLSKDETAAETLRTFIKTMNNIASFAPQYDYRNVQYNGYRSIIKLWSRIMKESLLITSNDELINFLLMIKSMEKQFKFVQEYHTMNQTNIYDHEYGKKNVVANQVLYFDGNIVSIMGAYPFASIQFAGMLRYLHQTFPIFISLLLPNISLYDRVRCLYSDKNRSRIIANALAKLNWQTLKHMFHYGDYGVKLLKYANESIEYVFRWNRDISIRNISSDIRRQYSLNLTINGIDIAVDNESVSKISYQVARYGSGAAKYSKKLLIFLHGGAFIGPKADVSEFLTVRNWIKNFPGLTVVNLDYSVCPEERFPKQIQELLDFYLWLIDARYRTDVLDTYGFSPTDVIIVGESAGAQFAVGLMILLNELREHFDNSIAFPKLVVLINGKINMNFQLAPSYTFVMVDPICTPLLGGVILQSYIPMKIYDVDMGSNRLLTNQEQMNLNQGAILEDKYDIVQDALLDPFSYSKYDTINTPLYIFTSEFDPLLDESILLARKWKSEVNIKVCEDMGHCSHLLYSISNQANDANNELVNLIRKSLD